MTILSHNISRNAILEEALKDEFAVVTVEMEIEIRAKSERVWQALTEELTAWWHKAHFATPSPQKMILEPKIGGQLYEESESGEAVQWYTVVRLVPGKKLSLVGHILPEFEGPVQTYLSLELSESANGTMLKLTDHLTGAVTESIHTGTRDGWRDVINDGFIPYIETHP